MQLQRLSLPSPYRFRHTDAEMETFHGRMVMSLEQWENQLFRFLNYLRENIKTAKGLSLNLSVPIGSSGSYGAPVSTPSFYHIDIGGIAIKASLPSTAPASETISVRITVHTPNEDKQLIITLLVNIGGTTTYELSTIDLQQLIPNEDVANYVRFEATSDAASSQATVNAYIVGCSFSNLI